MHPFVYLSISQSVFTDLFFFQILRKLHVIYHNNSQPILIIKRPRELRKVSLRQWLPHHLIYSQRNRIVVICPSLKNGLATKPFLVTIIPSDESVVFSNHIQRKTTTV